jgi:hypothetical protein
MALYEALQQEDPVSRTARRYGHLPIHLKKNGTTPILFILYYYYE